jgi:hypothetical protein
MPRALSIETPALLYRLITRLDATQSFIKVSSGRIHAHIHACATSLIESNIIIISDLKDKQLEIMALMNSWVFARLIVENERAGEALSREMDALVEAEREQGRSLLPSLLSCLPGTQASV